MNNLELDELNEFVRMPEKARLAMEKDHPTKHAKKMALVHKKWDEWQDIFRERAWTKDPDGMLKRTKGGMEHPFLKRVIVNFWPMPWGEAEKMKRKESKKLKGKEQTPVEKVVEEVGDEMEIPF